MKSYTCGVLCALGSVLFTQAQEKPKIVVGIVIDQMRHDYLQRFEAKFSENGFKRLAREGFEARNTHYNYIPTFTGPGHASIYTGTTPKYHGIIANDWYDRTFQKPIYCAEDSTVTNVGGSPASGKISPRNLKVTTITDELNLATNFRAKMVGISMKDRGAALPAGHAPSGAYWYDSKTGHFMTSTYYMAALPDWLVRFNARNLADSYSSLTWTTLLPVAEYVESTPDYTPYEMGFAGKDTPTFPYDLKELRKTDRFGLIRTTPFGNSLIIDLAKAAIEGERLGAGAITDFLTISFSSTDYVGHNFGTHSVELEDTYLRLDRELGELLIYLDRQYGKGHYLIFLTADHGAVENPQFLADRQLPGGYFDTSEMTRVLQRELGKAFGEGEWVENISNEQVFLNRRLVAAKGLDLAHVQAKAAQVVLEIKGVEEAYTGSNLATRDYSELRLAALQSGYNHKMSGDVLLLQSPGYLPGSYGKKGTSHGTGYVYDTHVPLLFFGTGVNHGSTLRVTSITDVAPTLSFLLDISLPNACTGQPIEEVFE